MSTIAAVQFPRSLVAGLIAIAAMGAGLFAPSVIARVSAAEPLKVVPATPEHPTFDTLLKLPPATYTFEPKLAPLWMEALKRPDVATRLQTANAIQIAVSEGMPGIDGAKPLLLAMLNGSELPLRFAAAEALIAFKDASTGPSLLHADAAASDQPELQKLLDAALVEWKVPGTSELLIGRLRDATASALAQQSAARCLGDLHDVAAVNALTEITLKSDALPALRLVAAQSLSKIGSPTITTLATKLLDGEPAMLSRLLVASLLTNATGAEAQTLLLKLVKDQEPAVVTIAAQRLFDIDPMLLAPFADSLKASSDNTVRLTLVRALFSQHTTPAADMLIALLGDESLIVRASAANALVQLDADTSMRVHLRESATTLLGSANDRSVAQSLHYLSNVKESSILKRAIELLRHQSHEVRVSAILAMRFFADPTTLDEQVQTIHQRLGELNSRRYPPAEPTEVEDEVAYLVENLGLAKDAKYDSVLLQLLPDKNAPILQARISCAWALSEIHRGDGNGRAASAMIGRIMDQDPQHPESPEVQHICLYTLGIIKAKSALAMLQQYTDDSVTSIAAKRSVAEINDQPLPPVTAPKHVARGWFLEPVVER